MKKKGFLFLFLISFFCFTSGVKADSYSYSWSGDFSITNGSNSVPVLTQYGMYGNQVNITKVSTDYQYLRFYNTDWHFDSTASSFLISGILMGRDGSMQMDKITCSNSHTNEYGVSTCTIYDGIVHHTISIDVIAYYNNDFYASHCKTNFTEQGYFLAECPIIEGMRGMSSIKVNMANSYISEDYSVFLGLTREMTWVHSDTSAIRDQTIQQHEDAQEQIKKQEELNNAVTSESDNPEDKSCGLICKLKGIFTGIIELPVKLITLLIDAMKSLFIPKDMSFINEFVASIENKLGFIAQIPMSIIEFTLNLASSTWQEFNSITFPTVSIFGYYFWEGQEIDLTEAINIFKPFKYLTNVLCVTLFCGTLLKWWKRFNGGDS